MSSVSDFLMISVAGFTGAMLPDKVPGGGIQSDEVETAADINEGIMKTSKLAAVFIALMVAGAGNSWADRGHHHHGGNVQFGVVIGPTWGPVLYPPAPYYYPPYYFRSYYPPVVIERPAPIVYVEQQPVAPTIAPPVQQTNYWYYCNDSRAYYPYVKECPGGWQKVLPKPAGQP